MRASVIIIATFVACFAVSALATGPGPAGPGAAKAGPAFDPANKLSEEKQKRTTYANCMVTANLQTAAMAACKAAALTSFGNTYSATMVDRQLDRAAIEKRQEAMKACMV